MASFFLAPDPLQSTFFIPGGATPGNGAQVFIYLAGTSTKQTVYKDNLGNTAWSNPIVLDSGGNLPSGGVIWIPTGVTIKAVWAPANDTDPPASPYRTIDNISGINDTNALVSEWISGSTPTFVSGTQFNVSGDLTATLTPNRRLKSTNTAGTIYSTIAQRSFASGSTTVNVVSDTGSLDSGLSALSYSIADPNNPSVSPSEIYRKGANVSSATNGTTDIWGTIGDLVHITGTTTIQHFSTAPYAGAEKTIITDAALTIVHNTISVPGNASVSTATNDRLTVRADTVSTSIITCYTKALTGAGTWKQPTVTNLYIATGTAVSSGTYTPPSGATRLRGRMAGGGGGGGGAPVGNAQTGTSTTFGALTAGGGGAGGATAGSGGTNTTSYTAYGMTGGSGSGGGVSNVAGVFMPGGSGGANHFGGAGGGGTGNVNAGSAVAMTGGGGGGGGAGAAQNAGAGGGAGGFIEFYINIPASTSFTYSIGPGGAAGTSTTAGGVGGSGVIVIEEYYAA